MTNTLLQDDAQGHNANDGAINKIDCLLLSYTINEHIFLNNFNISMTTIF